MIRQFEVHAMSCAAAANISETGMDLTLDPGYYFLVFRSNCTTAEFGTSGIPHRSFGSSALNTNGYNWLYSDTGTFAADGLPATFPTTVDYGTANSLRVMLQK